MEIPTVRDWQKVREYLDGKWPLPTPSYRVETIAGACHDWFVRAHSSPYVAIDTEYNVDTGYLLLVGLGFPGHDAVLQFDNKKAAWPERNEFGRQLRELVSNVPVVFQNAIADIPILELAYGIKHEDYKKIDDTMLAHAVLWSDWPHTLEFLASIYGKHNKMKHLSTTDPYLYNVGDVVDTLSAWEGLQKELKLDGLSKRIYMDQSLQTVPTILKSQRVGLRVNHDAVRGSLSQLLAERGWAQHTATVYCGYPINIGSDDQLKYYLYEQEKLPVQMVPRTDKRTVDGDAVAALRREFIDFDPEDEAKNGLSVDKALQYIALGAHPVLEARVVYASAQQQLSHYILPLVECNTEGVVIRIKDVIHPRFQVHAQASGRWSTVDPPLAQLPKKLQNIVLPFEGEKWVEWDWDQIELRLLSALSQDDIYEEAFRKGYDIHTLNACDVFGWNYPSDKRDPHTSDVDREWREKISWGGKDDPRRRFAKVFIFRLNYGGEAKTATDIPGVKQLGLKPSDLVHGSISYLNKHPRIRQYWNSIVSDGLSRREVRTFMGRRRRLLVDSKSAAKRIIYNHPMQGGVSDVFNLTLVTVARDIPDSTFAYGVHDSQKWAVPESKYDSYREQIYNIVHRPWNINGRQVVLPATFK